MDDDATIIAREERFWTGVLDHYERWLATEVVMVFPEPAGILDRAAVLDGIRTGSRWQQVEMTDLSLRRGAETILLAYRARARRAGSVAEYHALVGSVYIREDGAWKLAFHQHTPGGASP